MSENCNNCSDRSKVQGFNTCWKCLKAERYAQAKRIEKLEGIVMCMLKEVDIHEINPLPLRDEKVLTSMVRAVAEHLLNKKERANEVRSEKD